ncbi:MAG: DUF6391 domain-containing protein [Phototrophicaceae bacterium]
MLSKSFIPLINLFLDAPFIKETRQNHALEHATIHLLAARVGRLRIAGHSNPRGFILVGNDTATTPVVEKAVRDAIAQLRQGKRDLAIHPNCGTNLLTSASTVAGSLWFYIQLLQARRKVNWADLSTFILIGLVALVVSRPLGMWLQRHVTTKADLENLTLIAVKTIRFDWAGRRVALHFVSTAS